MGKTTFKYDKNGNLIAYRDGRKIGPVGGTGDAVVNSPKRKATRKKK